MLVFVMTIYLLFCSCYAPFCKGQHIAVTVSYICKWFLKIRSHSWLWLLLTSENRIWQNAHTCLITWYNPECLN